WVRAVAARAVAIIHEHVDDHLGRGTNGQTAQRAGRARARQRAQHRAHEFLEQALLVAEVEVDRPFGDARAAGDIIKPRCGKAPRGELLERGSEDGGASLLTPHRARILPRSALAGAGRATLFRLLWACDPVRPSSKND